MTLYVKKGNNISFNSMKPFNKTFFIVLTGFLLFADYLSAGVLTGTVLDKTNGQPVPFATIRVENTAHTMLTNESGQYRLRLAPGTYQIKFSHVAHYSQICKVTISDADTTLDIKLEEAVIVLPGTKVYERDYDAAQSIIVEAIKRKEALLSQLESIRFDAYTKLVVRDTSKDDSSSIMAITESQLVCYWEQPDNYNQTITARKVSSNLSNAEVLVAIGDIPNFNKNRIDIGSYSIVSPTATDALEHYNYYLLDTFYIDNKAIFRLEIEPKDPLDPLFYGTIDIADSTFAVVGVEVGFSEGVEIQYVSNLTYSQRYDQFENKYWMPIEVRLNGDVDITIPGLPIFTIDYVAALHNYTFEPVIPKGTFDYSLEVAENADDVDSATWDSGQLIPLTVLELRGYERIDSVTNAPKPVIQQILSKTLLLTSVIITNDEFFHFNRVEGAYLGFGHSWRKLFPNLTLDTKLGYAFSSELWQYQTGLTYRLWNRKRMDISFDYFDNITFRQTLNTTGATSYTMMALANKTDPFDYYRDKGYNIALAIDPVKHLRLTAGYNDTRQFSQKNNTEYSLFRDSKKHRLNPPIDDGKLRSVTFNIAYDSRPLMKLKNEEVRSFSLPYTNIEAGVEYASPDFIDNDFDFSRYYVSLHHTRQTLEMGITALYLYASTSERTLPPQRYFMVNFWKRILSTPLVFKTLKEINFCGDRTALAYLSHNFGRRLFKRSGLPLIKDLPFSFRLYGGIFWSDFNEPPAEPHDDYILTATKPYSEFGFSLGQLPPVNLNLYFTWQLSDYDTSNFAFNVGFSF